MFCGHCGKELPENARFCTNCGASLETVSPAPEAKPEPEAAPVTEPAPALTRQPVAEAPAQPTPEQPPVQKPAPAEPVQQQPVQEPIISGKNRRPMAILGIIAAVVVVLVVCVVAAASGVFGGADNKVQSAVSKSVKEWKSAVDAMGMPDVAELIESGNYSQELSVVLDRIPYVGSEMSGLGVQLKTATRLKDEKMLINLGLLADDDDEPVASVQLYANGDVLALGSPEIMKDTYLGVNTATLGKDLVELLDYDEGFGDLSFNVFELAQKLQKLSESVSYDEKAGKDLIKAIEVEKSDSREMNINSQRVKCTGYDVVIPVEAVETWLLAQVDTYRNSSVMEDVLDVLESTGLDMSDLDYDKDAVEDLADQMEESIEELIDEMEDIEAEVYISSGYVMAVTGEFELYGEVMEFEFYFGGGKNYVDDLSFEIHDEDENLSWKFESTGDHAGKSGTVTDKSTLTVESYGSVDMKLVSELSYEPKAEEDNFSWRLREREWDTFDIRAEGTLSTSSDAMRLDLEKLSLTADGETLSVAFVYAIENCKKVELPSGKPEMILTMTEDELYELAEEIVEDAQDFVSDLADDFPMLEDLLWYLT